MFQRFTECCLSYSCFCLRLQLQVSTKKTTFFFNLAHQNSSSILYGKQVSHMDIRVQSQQVVMFCLWQWWDQLHFSIAMFQPSVSIVRRLFDQKNASFKL